jgi:hypothetical protein
MRARNPAPIGDIRLAEVANQLPLFEKGAQPEGGGQPHAGGKQIRAHPGRESDEKKARAVDGMPHPSVQAGFDQLAWAGVLRFKKLANPKKPPGIDLTDG